MPNSSWTETGASISLVPVTTPINTGSDPENVNYLSNQDKINLMAQYSAELAMKTTLDTAAAGLSVSSAYYDNAVAAISTGLVAAGAPANWATIWPDGTTSGPWPNIQTSLANWWAQVAVQRTALQAAISAAQAAAAQEAAVAAATALAPAVVNGLPALPNSLYPAGKLAWDTSTNALYLSAGAAWTAQTVAAVDISGTLSAAQIASLAASQITGTLTAAQIASITAAQLTGQITGTQIANGAISTPQLAAGAVTAATIAAGTITAEQIAADTITAAQIAAGTVTAAQIAAGTIQASNIAADTITGNNIAANTITGNNIAAGTITANNIEAGTITSGQIAAGAITATQLAADSVTAGTIAAGAITADMITTGTLNAADVDITNINASNITTGTLAASMIEFPDGSQLTTAGVQMYQLSATPGGPYAVPTTLTEIPGMSVPVTANTASDVFNLFLSFDCEATAALPTNLQISVTLMIDGVNKATKNFYPTLPSGQSATFPWFTTFTGLSAGSHTIALYYSANFGPSNLSMFGDTNALIQRIF